MFGQEGPALSHLNNQGIKENDIFLFFGWFKRAEIVDGKFQYKKNAKDLHVIYGYLQVGKKYDTYDEIKKNFPWHPHADEYEKDRKLNAVYSATKQLSFLEEYPGYGTFKFNDKLVLTKENLSRSRWQLPECLKDKKITYHSKNSYKDEYFQSACIGQEFVVVDDIDKKIIDWIKGLFESQKNKS